MATDVTFLRFLLWLYALVLFVNGVLAGAAYGEGQAIGRFWAAVGLALVLTLTRKDEP